jgi:hypothetical protein
MMMNRPILALACVVAAASVLFGAGCATPRAPAPPAAAPAAAVAKPVGHSVLRAMPANRAGEDRILAMNPERVSADDVKALAGGPTPRIVLLHGGIYPVHLAMTSFGGFLTDMGYPEAKIRNPADDSWSHSPYEKSVQLAGLLAWYYEREGLRPIMIGHSQGGIQAVKILRELDGAYGERIVVWGPFDGGEPDRTSFVDPLTGAEKPVVGGFVVPYVSVVAAGGAALILPNQWSMIGNLRSIPNTVEDFTGYSVGLDFWAWTVPGVAATSEYAHNGSARVRNVMLPAWYNHVLLPVTKDLASDPLARAWIEAYAPGTDPDTAPLQSSGQSVYWAADVWYNVKKHWCLEAQRTIRARRAILGEAGQSG